MHYIGADASAPRCYTALVQCTPGGFTYPLEKACIRGHLLHGALDLFKVVSSGERLLPMRVQVTQVAIQTPPVITCQLRTNAIEGDVESTTVSLKWNGRRGWTRVSWLWLWFSTLKLF